MTSNRKYVRLREQGRRLASQREDLIAAGADPANLLIPLHPDEPEPRRVGRHANLADPYRDEPLYVEADYARVWMIVTLACIAAFLGWIAAAGAMLMIANALTWHVWGAFIMAAGWAGLATHAARNAHRLYRQARDRGMR